MAAGSTYTPISNYTITSETASYTFSSIPSIYTDLILVVNGTSTGTNINYGIRFNGDSAGNYSCIRYYGNGSTPISDYISNTGNAITSNFNATSSTAIYHIQNYSSTAMNKTMLVRSNSSAYLWANVACWRSNAAINSVEFVTTTGYGLLSGTKLSLYGIAAA